MKVVYVKKPFNIEIREEQIPACQADEVLVKVKACGICGTDIHIATSWAKDWMRFGHEVVGEVEEKGEGVSDLDKGDLVIVENSSFCGQCRACKNGDVAHCENIVTLRGKGGFSEYMLVPRQMLYRVKGLTTEEAVLSEPLTVALDIVQVAEVGLNDEVVIFGPGTIGLMVIKLCRLKGARKVYVTGTSLDEFKISLIKELGADEMINIDKQDAAGKVKELTKNIGVDKVLITAPPKVLPHAIEMARYGGIISLIGIDADDKSAIVPIDINKFHFQKLQLRASYAVPNLMFPLALDLIKRRVIDPNKFITHTFKLDDMEKALKLLAERREGVIKAIIVP
jgi:threonine dehydrogenase-like Zn-dependent dehydrogenase